ncbi:hypothetical protein DSM3645_08497 [Blastopirellula marina DSM 3645]|uniref:Uncharacterized protein n=1 Tax=Blastopirellula marina DSM 3645 TaxID=314230 RepID=A3ZKZ0_9BACT|nr:hypothetical protein DSM3645_08497 [Blastopirellula marina DSM 3645]
MQANLTIVADLPVARNRGCRGKIGDLIERTARLRRAQQILPKLRGARNHFATRPYLRFLD